MIYLRNSAPRNYNPYSIHLRPYKPLNYNSSPKVLLWHTSPTAAACDATEHVNKKPKNGELQSTSSQELADNNSSSRVVFQDRTTQVVDDKDSLIVSVDLPGVSSKDVTIEVANGVLSVAAERPARAGGNSTKQKQQFVINERKVDTDKLQANLVDGVLTITLPKKEETKPTAITVAAQGPPEEQINTNENNKDTDTGVWQFTYDLPGVKAQDIQLEVHEDTLTLHATRHHHRNGGTSATTMDRKFSVDPTRVDTESMQGYLADGVLTLRGTRRPESAQTKVVVVPVSCGNTTTVSSTQIDASSQKQIDDSSGENLEQDDMVLVETVQADDDDGTK